MDARLVREELEKCTRTEGVNGYENCKWLSDKLLDKLTDARVRGWILVLPMPNKNFSGSRLQKDRCIAFQ